MVKVSAKENKSLPDFLKPLLWSYNFAEIDAEKHKETIVVNAINYGDLSHWRWLIKVYGKDTIADILRKTPASALRPRVVRLVSIIFSINNFNYAPRSVKR